MLNRRDFIKRALAAGSMLAMGACEVAVPTPEPQAGVLVNDVQSQLNPTRVSRVLQPRSMDAIQLAVRNAAKGGKPVSIAGGRHAMGGQQFGQETLLIDITRFNRVVRFDRQNGLVEAEAGIQWPELIAFLNGQHDGLSQQWAIREKQSGVDRVCLAGCLAANIHGRGMIYPPIVSSVESFVLVDANGDAHNCSRSENPELFALAIGGYGLFGVITHVTLRLVPRMKIQQSVEMIAVDDLTPIISRRISEGFVFGDCQYATDMQLDGPPLQGVLTTSRPVHPDTPVHVSEVELSDEDWMNLYRLARTDKAKAFELYSQYCLAASGRVHWSDTYQLTGNFDAYRNAVDISHGTEMLTEVYVPRDDLAAFMSLMQQDMAAHQADVTYGTIRFIQNEDETFLAWARRPFACVVCNLNVKHTPEGKRKAAADFQRLIDRVIQFGGSYYLTYHRWAAPEQTLACYPQFVEFLRLKQKYDPQDRFQSEWYRYYRDVFADRI